MKVESGNTAASAAPGLTARTKPAPTAGAQARDWADAIPVCDAGGRPPRRTRWPRSAPRWVGAGAIAALVLLLNLAAWRAFNPPHPAPDAPARVAGLAYNAFQRWESPLSQRFPTETELAADLRLLASLTDRLRTYSALELPALPTLAEQSSLRLALGVWLDRRFDNNERELRAALDAARQHRSVERVIAGNETQVHQRLSPAELYGVLDRLRAALSVPVSTAEPWHIWLRQPELADHVDFITVHLLPYWEGVPMAAALDVALRRYEQVRARFPDQPVVIGEIGWPSGGPALGVALATPDAQAAFVRGFLAYAAAQDLDYYLMEAVDQPWKRATEGAVGAYWGLFDAARRPKFALIGPIDAEPYWRTKALISSMLGLAAMLPFLMAFAHMRLAGRLAFAFSAQAVASCAVLLATLPLVHYLGPLDGLVWVALGLALAVMAAILLAQSFEFAELFWSGSLRHQAPVRPADPGAPLPLVSIHLACRNEPPDMVIATIDSLLALDWPDFEILVVDNNTRDPSLWRPVQAYVETRVEALGSALVDRSTTAATCHRPPRLRFFHLPTWPGFKAGALNYALEQTDPNATWVAVVDADYLVQPGWLRSLAGYFADPGVAIVQAPQAHRDWDGRPLGRMMNWEYDGFFRIGMHHRHERDAIVQHGTMTLIRAAALRRVSGWATDCVCEDTELGLRLLQCGLRAVYVDRVLGTGLVPADFAAYQRQRRRWAQGGVQILRRHGRALLGPSALRLGQRYHFLAGWLPWMGDALHLAFSLAAIAWTLGVLAAPHLFGVPFALFIVPLGVFFLARLVLAPLLYWRRVPCPPSDILGAALAGMGLSHSIARGVLAGLTGRHAVFEVTRKGSATVPVGPSRVPVRAPVSAKAEGLFASVREEGALLLGLLVCVAALVLHREPGDLALAMWMVVLVMQALPYGAALGCALLSWADQPQTTLRPGRG
jgi:exo-beta-1,3-glucanase (GH17 family)/cellulose synthase/poly-beta-1,6-N-acetylglucosamine synthase-like glycosyltransferase